MKADLDMHRWTGTVLGITAVDNTLPVQEEGADQLQHVQTNEFSWSSYLAGRNLLYYSPILFG